MKFEWNFCNLWRWKKYDRQICLGEIWFPKGSGIIQITFLNFSVGVEWWKEN